MVFNLINGLLALGMLLSGCINTISKKAQNESYSVGWAGIYHKFKHPWFQTIIMFLGEALCLIGYLIQRRHMAQTISKQANVQQQSQTTPLLTSPTTPPNSTTPPTQSEGESKKIFQPILMIPTILDLLGTTFGGIGLVYCNASIWQMLRGSIIVFTGFLSWIFLKRKMLPYRWVSITFTIMGLICVALTQYFNAKDQANNKASSSLTEISSSSTTETVPIGLVILGICLILLGQLVGASQMVVEEKLLKAKNFQPLHIVGLEGIFGTLAMAFIVLPILFFIPGDNPSPLKYKTYEDSFDAILQIIHSWKLIGFSLLYFASIAFYNFFGLSVTKHLTCVHRTLIDACRTILVWTFELFLHYAIDKNSGESFNKYSFIQVAGFLLLIIGTLCYNAIIHLPFLEYEKPANSTVSAAPVVTSDKNAETTPLINPQEQKK